METLSILDVTVIEPRFKHPKIFEKYDLLNPGEAFIIKNDHDPKPLYYQLLAERGQTFTWKYLEEGPEFWNVEIKKNNEASDEETIGEIVSKDYRKAQVFKKFGIDFCCGGRRTISEVCNSKGIDAAEVEKELVLVGNNGSERNNDYLNWDIGELSDHIIHTHHQYIKGNVGFIAELANKVARVHGNYHPELIKVNEIFVRTANDLALHLLKEEKVVFPFIKELASIQKNGGTLSAGAFESVSSPLHILESEHEQAGEDLQMIRELTHNFQLPADACNSYTILFKKLDEFENDLHRHVHLENNVLFPKAILAEKSYRENV